MVDSEVATGSPDRWPRAVPIPPGQWQVRVRKCTCLPLSRHARESGAGSRPYFPRRVAVAMTLHCADESRRPDDDQRRCFAAECGSAAPRTPGSRSSAVQPGAGGRGCAGGGSGAALRRSRGCRPVRVEDLPRSGPSGATRRHRSGDQGGAGGEIVAILTGDAAPGGKVRPDDPELFARIAPLGLGGEVPERYVALLLEQGGFQKSQPTLPAASRCPRPPSWRSSVAAWRA